MASLESLIQVAQAHPDEFRLFFQRAGQEPQFREHADWLRTAMAETARPYLQQVLSDEAQRRWAAGLVPAVAIEAILTWLDAGSPKPERAADTISALIGSVVSSISQPTLVDDSP